RSVSAFSAPPLAKRIAGDGHTDAGLIRPAPIRGARQPLLSFDLPLQALQARTQKVGHGRSCSVVVEIVRRLVSGVPAIQAAVPLHLAGPAGGGLDDEGRRIGADR